MGIMNCLLFLQKCDEIKKQLVKFHWTLQSELAFGANHEVKYIGPPREGASPRQSKSKMEPKPYLTPKQVQKLSKNKNSSLRRNTELGHNLDLI